MITKYFPLFTAMAVSLVAQPAAPQAPEVRTAPVSRGDITRYAGLPGTLRANQQVTVYAKVGGYLKTVAVDRGDHVKTGQLLAEIEVPELEADLTVHRAEVRVAEADHKRVSGAQKSAPDLITAQAVDEALGRLEIARAHLERTEIMLGFTKVRSPLDGVVTARFLDRNAFVPAATSGSAAQSAAIVSLAEFSTIRAQVFLPESEAALARVGQPVKVSVEGMPGKVFEAKISRMAYALDEATRTMLVEADLPNKDLTLRPGMYATVRVGLDHHENALLMPVAGLVMEKAAAFAWVLRENAARKLPLKIGFNDGVNVEVLSGLTESDRVITAGQAALRDGMLVKSGEGR